MSRQSTQEFKMANRAAATVGAHPDYESIEALAYQRWLNRGCPVGSPEIDWNRAEEELRNSERVQRAA